MFGEYCSISSENVSLSSLTPVTFQQALDEYVELVGGKRIRGIRFQYVGSSQELASKIEAFFKTKFQRTTAGQLATFHYMGTVMTVTVHQRGIFRLSESF